MEKFNAIQVFNEEKESVYSIMNKIVNSGNQKEGFFVCNISELVYRYNKWTQLFPDVGIFYDVKCNDSRPVLETLAGLDAGFSCGSKEEIRKVISLGIAPHKIIFGNPTKKSSHIVYAAEVGVELLTFDNEEELYKIKKHHSSAKLILRITTEETWNNSSTFIRKFGVIPGDDARNLLAVAKSLNLNVTGVVFHLESSSSKNTKDYLRAIQETKRVFDIGSALGYNFTIIDIGGGYSATDEDTLENIADVVNESLANTFLGTQIQLIAEPGTYCVESAFKLITTIHSKKITSDDTRMYYLDIGVYNGLAPVHFNKFFECKPLKERSKDLYPSILWGPTLDGTDRISKDVDYLPEMDIGDWIIFEDTGANTLPLTCEFNGFPLPNIHSVVTQEAWLLLTEKAKLSIPKSKLVFGASLNYLTGLNDVPYVFNSPYY